MNFYFCDYPWVVYSTLILAIITTLYGLVPPVNTEHYTRKTISVILSFVLWLFIIGMGLHDVKKGIDAYQQVIDSTKTK
jgi:hypothetical protein